MENSGKRLLYLTPTATAQPGIYDPLSEYQRLILDAIDIGRMKSQKKTPQEIQKAIQIFAVKYGLLGLMTALPTTPNFMDYEAVYLPKIHFIRKESMWSISNDRAMMALALTMSTDKLTIVWDFHSLILGIQMMFSFMLTETEKPIRICKHCLQTFVASRQSAIFCSPQRKNKYNVYKSRANKNGSADNE